MSTERLLYDDLLGPIAPDQPAGANLRWFPEWDRIKEARQSEDDLSKGKWAKRESKTANWPLVQELTTALLQTRSKDLQLAMWLTEANIKLRGFAGLRDGLRLVHDLTSRFWESGLYPLIEDGPEDRAGPFVWLNDKAVDSVLAIPITCCDKGDANYSFLDLQDARLVGSEEQCRSKDDGEIDPQKKREYDKAIASGRTSLDMYRSAIDDSRRAPFEDLYSDFQQALEEFRNLEQVIDEKFGDTAPNLSEFRVALSDIQKELSDTLEKKRKQEPDASPLNGLDAVGGGAPAAGPLTVRFPLSNLTLQGSPSPGVDSWKAAEQSIRYGQVDSGLAEMRRLAANETTGRSRFERKLLLAEVCLATRRDRLARAVLQELAEQIEKHQLETWESSELISGVWTRLYELYKRGGSPDSEEAAKLYERLCRLDPWQALTCTE